MQWTSEAYTGLGLDRYLAFVRDHGETVGPFGDATRGEIQIAKDASTVQWCIQTMYARLEQAHAAGKSLFPLARLPEMVRVGIVYEDQYAFLVRYPVLFPGRNGGKPNPGMYLIWHWRQNFGKQGAICGMPVMPDGRLVLNRTFRHAPREWVLEFPRGGTDATSLIAALRQELGEEAGLEIGETVLLGSLSADSGILGGKIPVYLAKVVQVGSTSLEYSEAISGSVYLTATEFADVLKTQQWVEKTADGGERIYRVEGSFENFAFLQARLRGLV